GVLDNATAVPGDSVAPGDIMALKGEQLSFSAFSGLQSAPLPNQLGGASVTVNGTTAPLFYTSYGQLVFQMPVDVAAGTAQVQVTRDGTTSNTVSVNVAPRAPRIIAVVNQDNSINYLPGYSNTVAAHSGDFLTIYCIGLGPTSPVVPTGQPAPGAE